MPVAEQVVQHDRRLVAEEQRLVEAVELAVELVVLALDERQLGLQVPVADVGDVEAAGSR